MARIVDLTHPVFHAMPVFPGDPQVQIEVLRSLDAGQYRLSRVTLGTHAGTHLDAPRHCIADGQTVDQILLDNLVGWAEVLDMSEKGEGEEIDVQDFQRFESRIAEGSRLLVRTGWSKRFCDGGFFSDFPGITQEAAQWLVSHKVRLLGLEQPSTHPTEHLETHRILLSGGVALVESLANLDELSRERVYLVLLPIKLVGADGAPVRAIAIEDDSNCFAQISFQKGETRQ